MKKYTTFIIVSRKEDNTFDIFEKDLDTKRLTYHSNHATKEAALEERNSLQGKPSQAETLRFFNDLKLQINK